MLYSEENVLKAISVLYGKNSENILEAERFLKEFQKNTDGWDISLRLLQNPSFPEAAQMFAATTLKTKLMYDFDTIRENTKGLAAMRGILIHSIHSSSAKRSLKSILLLCLSYFIIQEQSESFLIDLIASFSFSDQSLLDALNIIKILFYETQNDDLVIDEIRRTTFIFILEDANETMFSFFDKCYTRSVDGSCSREESVLLFNTIMKALRAWAKNNYSPETTSFLIKNHSKLLIDIFNVRKEFSRQQCRCIERLLWLAHSSQNETLKIELLKPCYQYLLPLAEKALESKDFQLAQDLHNVMYMICYIRLNEMMYKPDESLLGIMLRFMKTVELSATDSCIFFKSLFKQIEKIKDADERNKHISVFSELMRQCLLTCIKRVTLTEETLILANNLDEDDDEYIDLFFPRQSFGSLARHIGNCIGIRNAFSLIFSNLLYEKSLFIPENQTADSTTLGHMPIQGLCSLEAHIFILSELFTSDLIIEMGRYLDFVKMSIMIGSGSVQICRTIFSMIWQISKYVCNYEELLKLLLQLIFESIAEPLLRVQASNLFLKLLEDNTDFFINHSDHFETTLLNKYKESLCSQLCTKEVEELLSAYTVIVTGYLEKEKIKKYLVEMLTPHILSLNMILGKPGEDNKMVSECKMLAAILFKCNRLQRFGEGNPMLEIIPELWKLLMKIFGLYYKNKFVLGALFKVLKAVMLCLNIQFQKYAEEFCQKMVEGFQLTHLPIYLYGGEIAAIQLGEFLCFELCLKWLLENLIKISFESPSESSRTAEFFSMCHKYLHSCPKILFSSSCLSELITHIVSSISLESLDGSNSIYLFLSLLFQNYMRPLPIPNSAVPTYVLQIIQNYIVDNGPLIAQQLISRIEKAPNRNINDNIILLLLKMLEFLPKLSIVWIDSAIKNVSPDCLTREEKKTLSDSLIGQKKDLITQYLETFASRALNSAKRNR